ncbi:MAG: GerMN domain-containing protein [Firmicutes bacterium]|nr:GerMN domain-containing protein [Bacillota bacterium]MBQ4091849.1 GerMN domain-containing protein [Bacillota bacterium]
MKKRGIVTGILFVALLAFVFQTEIGGFFASVRDKAFAAAEEDAETASLPQYVETESVSTEPEEKKGEAPPVPENTESTSADVTYKEVSLYYVDEAANSLAAETRSVVNQTGLAKTTLEELLTGPATETLASYIPAGTKVQSINIEEGGLCTVDFSKELQNSELNSSEEKYVIDSIVSTLSQFDSVNSVQIRINGHVVESIAGHWDVSKPLNAK